MPFLPPTNELFFYTPISQPDYLWFSLKRVPVLSFYVLVRSNTNSNRLSFATQFILQSVFYNNAGFLLKFQSNFNAGRHS